MEHVMKSSRLFSIYVYSATNKVGRSLGMRLHKPLHTCVAAARGRLPWHSTWLLFQTIHKFNKLSLVQTVTVCWANVQLKDFTKAIHGMQSKMLTDLNRCYYHFSHCFAPIIIHEDKHNLRHYPSHWTQNNHKNCNVMTRQQMTSHQF